MNIVFSATYYSQSTEPRLFPNTFLDDKLMHFNCIVKYFAVVVEVLCEHSSSPQSSPPSSSLLLLTKLLILRGNVPLNTSQHHGRLCKPPERYLAAHFFESGWTFCCFWIWFVSVLNCSPCCRPLSLTKDALPSLRLENWPSWPGWAPILFQKCLPKSLWNRLHFTVQHRLQ